MVNEILTRGLNQRVKQRPSHDLRWTAATRVFESAAPPSRTTAGDVRQAHHEGVKSLAPTGRAAPDPLDLSRGPSARTAPRVQP